MKGINILKPLELSLETKEENWHQGTLVHGILKIKNLESTDYKLEQYQIALGYADIKKVHAKTAGCFKIAEFINVPSEVIKGSGLFEFPFEFKLSANIAVTDKKASFHLLYGKVESPFHLQMMILPQPIFLEVIKLFDTFFRFKVKECKGTNKGVEYIITPPASKEYAFVESVNLLLTMKEQDLQLDFTFHLKKLDLTGVPGTTNKLAKEIKAVAKTLTPKEYMMGKYLDQDKLLKAFEAILSEVKRKEII